MFKFFAPKSSVIDESGRIALPTFDLNELTEDFGRRERRHWADEIDAFVRDNGESYVTLSANRYYYHDETLSLSELAEMLRV